VSHDGGNRSPGAKQVDRLWVDCHYIEKINGRFLLKEDERRPAQYRAGLELAISPG
jgi:hypothetical protein